MKYIQYENGIHNVYGSLKEFKAAGYAQRKPIDYLSLVGKSFKSRELQGKGLVVGRWISVFAGKNQGIMQILAIKNVKSKTIFKTAFGWGTLGLNDPDFNPEMFYSVHKRLIMPQEINFAASFALHGDLGKAFVENMSVKTGKGGNVLSKKKSYPFLSESCQTLSYGRNLEALRCRVN